MANNLFQTGLFTLASGRKSNFKIECDALTKEDWETVASLIAGRIKFRKVLGIPRGGLKLSEPLEKYAIDDPELPILIVDDVWTTGGSIRKFIMQNDLGYANYRVFVLFARGPLADDMICQSVFNLIEGA